MPAQEESFIDLNRNDRYASRVFTLAVKFFGAAKAISSSTIHQDLYPELDERSFNRQFLRDRNMLAALGMVINEIPTPDNDSLWAVDECTSYVQGEGIDLQDARTLYVLCHDLVFDQAFPYRDELRVALIKIAQIYQTVAIPAPSTSDSADRKVLAALVAAMENHEALDARYVDAQGTPSKRLLAPLGSFGLRDHTYFVASRIEPDGTLVPNSLRTYRLDRFTHVAATRPTISYEIPQDFSVRDYIRLPFQIGATVGVAHLDLGDAASNEAWRAADMAGHVTKSMWEVPYSSPQALAAWCIANNVTPYAPSELVGTYQDALKAARSRNPYDPSLKSYAQRPARHPHQTRATVVDAVTKVRQLIALAGSLTREGEVITADQVSQALSVSYDQARRLIMLVTMGSGESFDYLPLVIDDDYSEVFLMEGARLSMPRLRLTRSETRALLAALTELGVSANDPLARTLSNSYASPAFSQDDVASSLGLTELTCDVDDLHLCSQAIADEKSLHFTYRPVVGTQPSRRTVVPLFVRRSDDYWYLDAFDLMRQDARVFRIDRMSDLRTAPRPSDWRGTIAHDHTRMVTVRFDDPLYLDVFHWEGLEVVGRRDGVTVARLPLYGGTWLARHLVACAGTVAVDDEGLATQMGELLRAM